MSVSDVLVLAAAVGAIVWVNWYFLFAEGRTGVAALSGPGPQEIAIRVAGGYEPARVVVRRGRPVRLIFDRQETSNCSEEVVIPEFSIRRFLPAFQRTAVEFIPEKSGVFEFTCGMSMLRGKIEVVEEVEE